MRGDRKFGSRVRQQLVDAQHEWTGRFGKLRHQCLVHARIE